MTNEIHVYQLFPLYGTSSNNELLFAPATNISSDLFLYPYIVWYVSKHWWYHLFCIYMIDNMILEIKMAMRHLGPFTESPTASHTCWDIPPNLTYGTWYPKYITFSVKSTKFFIFHFWGCVSPHLSRAPWPLAPRLAGHITESNYPKPHLTFLVMSF